MAEALEDLSSEQQHHASSIKSSGYWCCKVCHDGPKSSFQNYCRNCGSRRELNSISDGMDLINSEGEIANKQSSEFKNLEVPASDWKLAMRGKNSASTKESTGLTYHDIGVKRGKDGLQDWATRHSTVGVKVMNSRLRVVSRRPGKFGINISFSETQLGQVSTAIVKPGLDVKPMKKGLMDGHRSSSVAPAIALYVRALHDYHAEDKTKISLRCGDIIQVVETNESGWWDGIKNGSDGWDGNHHTVRGWFPSNHCTFKTYQEPFASVSQAEPVISGGEVVDWNNATQTVIPYVYACFDYESECERELSFRRGDAIQVIDRPDSGWWDGVSNGARGWFPSSYCTEHIGHRSGTSEAQKETDRIGTEGDFESKDNLYSCTDSLANDSSNTKPGAGSTLESVDAHSHQKRIKGTRSQKDHGERPYSNILYSHESLRWLQKKENQMRHCYDQYMALYSMRKTQIALRTSYVEL